MWQPNSRTKNARLKEKTSNARARATRLLWGIKLSWLLFMDESGHDHKNMPFEARGGVALHASKVWSFFRAWLEAEIETFGSPANELGLEIKGSKLLKKERFKWAQQMKPLDNAARIRGVNRFVTKTKQSVPVSYRDFTAYGQASILMADRIVQLLFENDAVLFTSLIPRGVKPPLEYRFDHYLRKDHIFLQERFFYFLERQQEHGLLVMDQTEKQHDGRFVRRLYNYYTRTDPGRSRAHWIVPVPLFVDSELSLGIQAADLCLYCVNWGFRRAERGFSGPVRMDIRERYAGRMGKLQFSGDGYRDGKTFLTHGIVYVPDPYSSRRES